MNPAPARHGGARTDAAGAMDPISFVVHSIPVAKPRHRTFGFAVGDKIQTRQYMPAAGAKAEAEFMALADPFAPASPLEGPLQLELRFSLPVPESRPLWWKAAARGGLIWPVKKPDVDNLEKLVLDALTRSGRWWRDDSQVCRIASEKVYGALPGTFVRITPLAQATGPHALTAPVAQRSMFGDGGS